MTSFRSMAWFTSPTRPNILLGPVTHDDVTEADELATLLPSGVYVASVHGSALVFSPSIVIPGIAIDFPFLAVVNRTRWVDVHVAFVPVPFDAVNPERFVLTYPTKHHRCPAFILGADR